MEAYLKRNGAISPEDYLAKAKAKAKEAGLKADTLTFSDDKKHKLEIKDNYGRITRFGLVGYGDFILYNAWADKGLVDKNMPLVKRNTFLKSHSKIKGYWRNNPYSPNNLAMKILW